MAGAVASSAPRVLVEFLGSDDAQRGDFGGTGGMVAGDAEADGIGI